MEAVAEGLWSLAERFEESGCIAQSVKCLEAICQSHVSFLPILEVKTRLRIATLLLDHTDNVTHAKSHLERAQLLLKQIPSCFELKCRAYSLLSRCYHLVGTIPPLKQTLKKGLELATSAGEGESAQLWACNFNLQLANALTTEGDFPSAIRALESGLKSAIKTARHDLEMVFATSILHVHLMQWDDPASVEQAVAKCDEVWNSISSGQKKSCLGLHLYNELLHTFYLLRTCDYKEALCHIDILDAALKETQQEIFDGVDDQNNFTHPKLKEQPKGRENEMAPSDPSSVKRVKLSATQHKLQTVEQQLEVKRAQNQDSSASMNKMSNTSGKLELGPAPLDGEWLPKSAVAVLIDLMAVVCARPKGMFKECGKRLLSGMNCAQEELQNLGITTDITEVDLKHWAIWMSGVYLILLLQLLENKVIIDLTRTEFVEAQESLMQVVDWFSRFPTILQGCETTIQMLLGQYAHSVGCFNEAALHFVEAARVRGQSFQLGMPTC